MILFYCKNLNFLKLVNLVLSYNNINERSNTNYKIKCKVIINLTINQEHIISLNIFLLHMICIINKWV